MWPEIPSHRPKNHAIQSNELDKKYCVAWIAIIIGPKPWTLSCPSWLMGKSCCSICKMLLVGLYQILWFASLSCIKILVLHHVPACLRYSKYMLRGSSINKAWRFMILHNPPLTNSTYVPEYPITCRKWHLVPRKFTLVQTIISGVWESDGFVDVAHCWWFCTHCSHQLLYKRGHLSRNPATLVELSHFCMSLSNFGFEYKLGISFSSGICCRCGPGWRQPGLWKVDCTGTSWRTIWRWVGSECMYRMIKRLCWKNQGGHGGVTHEFRVRSLGYWNVVSR